MPAIAALTIADGQSTPVDHTFGVVSTNGAKAEFAERSADIPEGFFVLTHEVTRGATAAAADRVKVGLNMPTTSTVGDVSQVVRNSSAQVVLNLSKRSTSQERKDLLAYVANFLTSAEFEETVENLEPFY